MTLLKKLATLTLLVLSLHAVGQQVEFVENKGQWDPRVKFMGDVGGGGFFLEKTGYKVHMYNPDDLRLLNERYSNHSDGKAQGNNAAARGTGSNSAGGVMPGSPMLVRSHAYEVTFLGGNPNPSMVPDKPLDTYNNYFIGSDSTKWAAHCRVFQAVVCKDVYPGIDVRYHSESGQLEYDLIVNPGADPARIALKFDGADKLETKYHNLSIKTSVGEINELRPVSFQPGEAGRKQVGSAFSVKDNIVRFKVEDYDRTKPLVIDPTLIFSSFSGSKADNWGYTATYDGQGNMYGAGIVFGTGFPTSNGAFQTTFQGGGRQGYDVGIIKLNANGTARLYATYLGGTGNEQPHSLIVDGQGNLIVAGRTTSTADFPVTQTTYGPGGGYDIFLTKINSTGTKLVGSRLIGGSSDDGVNIKDKEAGGGATSVRRNYGDDARSEVIVDGADNIYLTGQTQSANFPTTAGAFQTQSGGAQDGILLKTSGNLSVINFSSYLGGQGDDATFSLAISPVNGNIYVGGATTSVNLPGVASGVIGPVFAGGVCDGFVAIVTPTGNSIVRASYFGTGGNDMVFGVQFDKYGYPYIMGTTTGSWPVLNAAFSQANGKQFISKLKPDLSGYEYSTVFGTGRSTPDISPVAFLVDRCENVYVSGWGGGINVSGGYENSGTIGLLQKGTSISNRPSDGSDFYFFVMKKNAEDVLFADIFGEKGGEVGDHVDGGTSRFDKQGVIYQAICANCGKQGQFPTTGGVWSPDNQSQSPSFCNLAMVKMAFELAGVGAGLQATINGVKNKRSGCIPLTVDFTDTLALAKQYRWRFGDGSPDTVTTVAAVSHTYTVIGDFQVRLIAIDSNTCNVADTAFITIRARANKANLSFVTNKLLPCDSLNYRFDNTSTASRPFTDSSFMWTFGDGTVNPAAGLQSQTHKYTAAGPYTVTLSLIDTNYCDYPDSVSQTIRIASLAKAQFITPASACFPYTAVFTNTSLGGTRFFWDFGDGTTSTAQDPTHDYATTGTFTVKLVVVDSATCNISDSTSQTITVSGKPTATFNFSPSTPEPNTALTFTNLSTGAVFYNWNFGDGDTLATARRDTILRHIYTASGTYNVCLAATNSFGCQDTTCQSVQAIVLPVADIPNAFTPNGDGINDVVRVRGYGIEKLTFRIYNRWGILVYQSTNPTDPGWNGYYNGHLQPQDVYNYTADIQFSDKSRVIKKGDITLLR